MALTVNAKTYTGDSFSSSVVGYNGPAKTLTIKDDLSLSRVAPKPNNVTSGVSRSTIRLARTSTLVGAIQPTGDLIVRVEVSAPVGTPSADIDSALNDIGALLSSASGKLIVKTPQISF